MVLNLDMEFRASSAGMSTISASPFHEYPMDQSEFQYIEDSLGDNYFDVVMAENTRPVTANGEGGGGGGGRGGGGGGGGGEVGMVGGEEDLNSYFVSTPNAASRQTGNYFVSDVGLNGGPQNGPHHHHQQRLRPGGGDVMMGNLDQTENVTRLGRGLSVASEESSNLGGDSNSSSMGGEMVEDVMMGAMTMQYMLEEGGDTFQSVEEEEEVEDHTEAHTPCDVRFSTEGVNKNKISPLQRKTLDAIFEITDKPSRGMINHIALTLTLADITVKNFFSNARRRRRRAEARLQDPDRARRENERRKEKRRLAAEARLHSSSSSSIAEKTTTGLSNNNTTTINNNDTSVNHNKKSSSSPSLSSNGSPSERGVGLQEEKAEVKEMAVLSPERKVLMEKLADKVQRNALKNLTAELNNVATEDHNQNLKNLMSSVDDDYHLLPDFNQNLRSLEMPEDTTGPLPGFHADPGTVVLPPFPDYSDPSGCWQSLDAFIN
ncbi:uncharacterized protein LOC143040656 [Oratosquilla oratoria]|uniref:uncharacterized protein LOC143040656 n=1 Tax=Oratosquilla oratoria TaxID=337810 RepID=UPI003F76662B